jgi:hypothetical protein
VGVGQNGMPAGGQLAKISGDSGLEVPGGGGAAPCSGEGPAVGSPHLHPVLRSVRSMRPCHLQLQQMTNGQWPTRGAEEQRGKEALL